MASVAEQQLEFLRQGAALDPPPFIMGGYAEEALLAGTVTRPHEDVDWLLPRSQLELRLAQARHSASRSSRPGVRLRPGEPFYLFGQQGELRLDLGIADEADGALLVKVHRLSFDVGGREAPAGYQVHLPPDTFAHPPVEIDGVAIRAASPLCLYQMRVGIASRGSFGELFERQRESLRRLREAFFPDRSETEL